MWWTGEGRTGNGGETLSGGRVVWITPPETAIHQTGSPEITWHAGKQNLKINEKGKERWASSIEPRGGNEKGFKWIHYKTI